MSISTLDHQFMLQAIQLAEQGRYSSHPNPRVGCVLVKDSVIAAQGWHRQAGQPHAEINALQQIDHQAQGMTAYVTLEPCSHFGRTPPCCDALIKAGVRRVVIAMQDPNPLVQGRGIDRLKQAGIVVDCGVQEQAARNLNPGFIKRMITGRPYIRCKMAASLDGQTALANGASQWITSVQARADVQRLRAQSDAVMTGIGTVLADNPAMNVRDSQYPLIRQPARIILDSQLRMDPLAAILQADAQLIVFTLSSAVQNPQPSVSALQANKQLQIETVSGDHNGLNLKQVADKLGQMQFNEVLLESGRQLAGAMLAAGLIDELILYLAPKLMGCSGKGVFDLPLFQSMSEVIELTLEDIRMVGPDVRLTLRPKKLF